MRVHFARVDSLVERVHRGFALPDPVPVTVWNLPLRDVARSLLELADSAFAVIERGTPEDVMYWQANLRSIWITAEQERRRLERGGS
jgi:hypothetical protein